MNTWSDREQNDNASSPNSAAAEVADEATVLCSQLDHVAKSTPKRAPRRRRRCNAELQYARDAIGTWILLMDSKAGEAIPLALYGADRQDECARVLAVLGMNAQDDADE